MPQTKKRRGRPAQRFKLPGSFESIAATLANVPKPEGGFPTPETMTKKPRKPKR